MGRRCLCFAAGHRRPGLLTISAAIWGEVIRIDEDRIKGHLGEMVRARSKKR